MKKIILVLVTLLLFFACKEENPVENQEPFNVTILSQDGEPVIGATVTGGIDWDYYSVQTNTSGVAVLPGSTRNNRATIYKTNFLPIIVSYISPMSYTLNQTEKRLDYIGNVFGQIVRFKENEIITLDYQGIYRVYSFNAMLVEEIHNQSLGELATAIREIKLQGDTLWFKTHESGIFAFSVQNPSSPELLVHIPIEGYFGPFDVKDSIIVIGNNSRPDAFRILTYRPNGEFEEISRIENYFIRELTIIGNYVILLGNNDTLPTVFDISNPENPKIVYNGIEWEYQSGFFYQNRTILTPKNGYGGDNIRLDYKVIDLSNPSIPTTSNLFTADSWITGLASNHLAFGNYYYHNQTSSLLEGSISNRFKTIATVSEGTIEGIGSANPPYFIISERLWKLNNRE